MPARRLTPRRVEKLWGRRDLPLPFATVPPEEPPVGEIWFDDPRGGEAELLIKYLFTSEKLSVQVHPNAAGAAEGGAGRGKDEAWWVLSADEGATVGLGLVEPLSEDELRSAALDGRIEDLVDWRPVRPGDSFYSPAGTIHAIGSGLSLIEVQQNTDVTYRLFDYGRGRELHVDEAVSVALRTTFSDSTSTRRRLSPGREIVATGTAFSVELWTDARTGTLDGNGWWIVPLNEGAFLDRHPLKAGEVWTAEDATMLSMSDRCRLLVAYSHETNGEPAFRASTQAPPVYPPLA